MKKKILLWIALIIFAVLFILTALWGRRYYTDRYVGTDYYSMVPLDYDISQKPQYSMSGGEIGTGVVYGLAAYDANGEKKNVSFTVYSPESGLSRGEIQPKPGEFLRVSASKQIVLRWRVIEKNEIPGAALEKILSN